jgi:peptidoglycan hydrolase-like protein with peptidoglycan-binding domain
MSGRAVNAQQQTKLQQSVLHSNKVTRVNDSSINFRVDTGEVVPQRISVVSVSTFPVLVDMYPAYRHDSFFVVDDEIVVLDSSRRIVDVIPTGSRTRYSHHGGSGGSVAVLDLSREEIRVVQRVLIERGLLSGEADGIFGPRTREALITFQKRKGLEANGRISRQTVAALGISDRISATKNQTTTGQGQAGQASAHQSTEQNSGQPKTSEQQNQPSANDQAQQNRPSTTGQAGKPHTSGQAAAPASAGNEPNNQPSGQKNGEPPSSGTQASHGGSGRK